MARSATKVVFLQLGDDWDEISALLTNPEARGPFAPQGSHHFRINVRAQVASTQARRLCLLARGDQLVALGLIRSQGKSGDLDIIVRVDDVHVLGSVIHLEQAVRRLPPRLVPYVAALPQTGILSERAGGELLRALAEISGEFAKAAGTLQTRLDDVRSVGDHAQAVAELNDALALGLRLAGFPTRTLSDRATDATTTATYFEHLESSQGRAPSEAAMIRHDATHFGDWIPSDGEVLDVVEFADPYDDRRRVTVLYADKEREEHITGADLIYFRIHSPGFVLVQYKRMRQEGASSRRSYCYRPDAQLRKEIGRMRQTLSAIPTSEVQPEDLGVSTWRLHDQPFYIKLVQHGRLRPAEGDLIKGMYFPIDLFELLLDSPAVRGPQKTRPIGWDNAGRWLSNTHFLSLMQDGWIGSTGMTTAYLQQVVDEVWATGNSVLIVRDDSTSQGREG